MENNEELNRSLVLLLKMFKNRPYHLAKYLIDNSALNQDFIKKILKSDKLKELSDENSSSVVPVYFVDISQMDEFYKSFIDDIKQISKEKSIEDITKDLNEKLNDCIKNEKYEDAARIRDYMLRNGIKRINNNF
jgi:excinuclease UvrABC helicase subunit UvrB